MSKREISAIVLHHSADISPGNQYNKVWQYHDRGGGGKWPKHRGMQYHYFLERDGTFDTGKPVEQVGWHAGTTEWNYKSIGICLAGDFSKESPPHEQIHTMAALIMELQNKYGIPDENIKLHREIRDTSCPAIDLREALIHERVNILKMRLDAAKAALKRPQNILRKNMLRRLIERLEKIVRLQ